MVLFWTRGEDIGGYSEDDIEAMRDAGLTVDDIAEITGTSQKYDGTQPSQSEQPTDESVVVIPNNPDETTRVDYELTFYINDIHTENTQVLMKYGKRDALKNVYTYLMRFLGK